MYLPLTFDAAVLTFAAKNAPTTGGAVVTISGLDFGATDLTPTAAAARGGICRTTAWSSGTTVQCVSHAGGALGTTQPIFYGAALVLGGVLTGTAARTIMTFDAPSVSFSERPGTCRTREGRG
jgi:hypothetical protein